MIAVNVMSGEAVSSPLAAVSVGLREEDMLRGGIGCMCRAALLHAVPAGWRGCKTKDFISIHPKT